MDIEQLKKKITKRTKAIIATHIYNFPLEMDKIKMICKKYKIKLIEDAAEVIGLKYKKKMCGSFGDISTFSFYANKHITTGEGGMILTDDIKIYQKCASLKNLCFGTKDKRFLHSDIGWNNFIFDVIDSLNKKGRVVFMLWGNNAKKYLNRIDRNTNLALTSSHPSPLSAYKGFFGCKHFSKCNSYLRKNNSEPIHW